MKTITATLVFTGILVFGASDVMSMVYSEEDLERCISEAKEFNHTMSGMNYNRCKASQIISGECVPMNWYDMKLNACLTDAAEKAKKD